MDDGGGDQACRCDTEAQNGWMFFCEGFQGLVYPLKLLLDRLYIESFDNQRSTQRHSPFPTWVYPKNHAVHQIYPKSYC